MRALVIIFGIVVCVATAAMLSLQLQQDEQERLKESTTNDKDVDRMDPPLSADTESASADLKQPQLRAKLVAPIVPADQLPQEQDYFPQADSLNNPHPDHPAVQARLAAMQGSDQEVAQNLHAMTAMAQPKPFDLAAYQADPAAYLRVADPSRIHQRAKAGPGVPRIAMVGEPMFDVAPASRSPLAVRVPPGAPVTFHAYDRGAFPNGLSTITVQANEEGLAQTHYFITTGTVADCNVKAVSPITSGQVDFFITVLESE